MDSKICPKCGKELLMNRFHKSKNTKDGYSCWCAECSSKKAKERYKNKREEILIKSNQYYKEHKDEVLNRLSDSYNNDKNKILERNKIWQIKNRDKVLAKRKEYRELNKSKVAEGKRKWFEKHPEKIILYGQRYNARKKSLPCTLTTEQWNKIKQHFNNSCAYCGRELPLAQEHVIPLSKGGEYTAGNIIPSCKYCNSSKATKSFKVWYKTYKFYSKKRERAIVEFLGYEGSNQQLKIV